MDEGGANWIPGSGPKGVEVPVVAFGAGWDAVLVVTRHGDTAEAGFGQQGRELADAPVLEAERLQLGRDESAVGPLLLAEPLRRLVDGGVAVDVHGLQRPDERPSPPGPHRHRLDDQAQCPEVDRQPA